MAEEPKVDSLTRRRSGFSVAPSPFNGVKLNLALVLCGALVLWLVVGRLASPALQLLCLAGYSALAAGWLMVTIRRVAARNLHAGGSGEST